MADYRERIAKRIVREAAIHGESPADLAHALRIHPSTPERWFRGERTPQPRHRKQLAEHWELPFEEFEFDLEAEDEEVRAQLDRIEEKLDAMATQRDAEAAANAEMRTQIAELATRQERRASGAK